LRRCASSVWKVSSAKRIDSIYEPGERSGAWIKHRTNREQEFVIGGYIPGAHWFDAPCSLEFTKTKSSSS
jgi:hypothetical protein